jgi:hypothetical protein
MISVLVAPEIAEVKICILISFSVLFLIYDNILNKSMHKSKTKLYYSKYCSLNRLPL